MRKKLFAWLLVITMVLACMPAVSLADYDFAFDASVDSVCVGSTTQLVLNRVGEALSAEEPVKFFSSDKKVATVDENGVVYGVSRGKATITARLETKKHTYRTMITVSVSQPVTNIIVDEKNMVIYDPTHPSVAELLTPLADDDAANGYTVIGMLQGNKLALNLKTEPWDASKRGLTVTSSDPAVVSVMNDTTLYAASRGDCVVTIASDTYPDVCRKYRVLVIDPVRSVQVSLDRPYIYNNDMLQANVLVGPENATIKGVNWTSSNPSVAMVDQNGLITGIKQGIAVITAAAIDGSGVKGSATLQVKQRPEAVVFANSYSTVAAGYSTALKATVLPANADSKDLAWASSDTSVAVVAPNGVVTGIQPGACVVTASCIDFPNIYAMQTVQVRQPVQSIRFYQSYMEMTVGQAIQLGWSVYPAELQDTIVAFSSSDNSVASVDERGILRAYNGGYATITVRAMDGTNCSTSMQVYMRQPVTGVSMASSGYSVQPGKSAKVRAIIQPSNASNQNMYWRTGDRSIATVSGYGTTATVTGVNYGVTTLYGTTEDGNYTTSCKIYVYDPSTIAANVRISELYIQNNAVKITLTNNNNVAIARVDFHIVLLDKNGDPLPCTSSGSNSFTGSYRHTLKAYGQTGHGMFTFDQYRQPSELIGTVKMYLDSCQLSDGTYITLNDSYSITVN